MWTCWKCSYAYNPVKSANCEICKLPRPPNARDKPAAAAAAATKSVPPRRRRERDAMNGSGGGSGGGDLEEDFQLVTGDLTSRALVGNCSDAADGDQREKNGGGGGDVNHHHHHTPSANGGRKEEEEENCWVCKRCTLENPRDSDLCLACGGARRRSNRSGDGGGGGGSGGSNGGAAAEKQDQVVRSKKWACTKCTLLNEPSEPVCVACENPRENKKQHQRQHRQEQQQQQQQQQQKQQQQQQQQQQKQQQQQHDPPPSSSGPRCPACTFENASTATICAMCGTVLGNRRAEEEGRRSSAR